MLVASGLTRPSSCTLWPIYSWLHNSRINRYGINKTRNLSRATMTQNRNRTVIMLATPFRADSDTKRYVKWKKNKFPISKWHEMNCSAMNEHKITTEIILNPKNNVLRPQVIRCKSTANISIFYTKNEKVSNWTRLESADNAYKK